MGEISVWGSAGMSELDKMFENKPELLTVPEVAEILRMTKQAVYNWLREGELPGYKISKTWFISRDELKETLRKGANKASRQDP